MLKKYVQWMQQNIEGYRGLDDNHLRKEIAESLNLHFNVRDTNITEKVYQELVKDSNKTQ